MNFLQGGSGEGIEEKNCDMVEPAIEEERHELTEEATALAGSMATEPLLDDVHRRIFMHKHYSRMDSMGG